MTTQTKKELDLLIKIHEGMTQKIEIAEPILLGTIVQMARDENDEMALYMLHHLNPASLRNEEQNDIFLS